MSINQRPPQLNTGGEFWYFYWCKRFPGIIFMARSISLHLQTFPSSHKSAFCFFKSRGQRFTAPAGNTASCFIGLSQGCPIILRWINSWPQRENRWQHRPPFGWVPNYMCTNGRGWSVWSWWTKEGGENPLWLWSKSEHCNSSELIDWSIIIMFVYEWELSVKIILMH